MAKSTFKVLFDVNGSNKVRTLERENRNLHERVLNLKKKPDKGNSNRLNRCRRLKMLTSNKTANCQNS